MKKAILRYGSYAAIFELIIFVLTWLVIWLFNPSHSAQGYIGWVNLLCPLLFVYFGIRYYRDKYNDGSITFLKALGLGLLIVILPAIAFGIIETVYVEYIDPKFYEKLMVHDIELYRKSLSPAKFAAQLKQMKQELEMDKNPLYNFFQMFLTVGCLGILITLISSLLLMKKATKRES